MVLNNLRKLTFIVNTAILLMVFGLMAFFYAIGAEFLVYFSIPTALVYVIGYILISKNLGIANRNEAETIDKWIQVADNRLYEGKESGKNKVVY